jgi:hypothetical protein
MANQVVLPLDGNGDLHVMAVNHRAQGQEVVISASISGYFTTGIPRSAGAYEPVAPTELLPPPGKVYVAGAMNSISAVVQQGTDKGIVPAHSVSEAILLVTVTGPDSAGLVTVNADDERTLATSNINFYAGQNITGMVIAPLTPDGKVTIHLAPSTARTDLIVDILGYFTSGSA